MKPEHVKKMIAPIVIAAVIILYYIFFLVICMLVPVPFGIKLFMGIVPLGLAGVMIFVLIERIQEIRSGEEDDLSKY